MMNRKLISLIAVALVVAANSMAGIARGEDPIHITSIRDDEITALEGARSIVIVGDLAYITGQGENGVEILDISDPTNPTHVGAIFDNATTALNAASSWEFSDRLKKWSPSKWVSRVVPSKDISTEERVLRRPHHSAPPRKSRPCSSFMRGEQ